MNNKYSKNRPPFVKKVVTLSFIFINSKLFMINKKNQSINRIQINIV